MKSFNLKYLKNKLFRIHEQSSVRFLIAGGFNTLLTYLMYLLFVIFMNYNLAYLVSYVLGIGIAFLLNSYYVFRASLSFKRFLLYPSIYFVQYMIGAVLLNFFVVFLSLGKEVAPIIVIVCNIPIGYFLNKKIITFKRQV